MNDDDLRSAFADLLHDLPDDRGLPPAAAQRIARRRGLKIAAGAIGGLGAVVTAAVLVVGAGPSGGDRLIGPAQPTASPSVAPSSSPVDPQPAEEIVLRPDGLVLRGSAVPFGTAAGTVRAAVDQILGEGGTLETPDCGPGTSTVQYENLFVLLQDDRFVGWVTGSPGLTTADGIGIGTTLAELRAVLPDVTVSEGSLGPEWSSDGGLAGFLDGTAADSIVNSMGAGERCLAR